MMRLREIRARRAVLRQETARARALLARNAVDVGTALSAAAVGVAAARFLVTRIPLRGLVAVAAGVVALVRALVS